MASRRIGITHMEEALIFKNMAWKSYDVIFYLFTPDSTR
jgi:hypothetical protein